MSSKLHKAKVIITNSTNPIYDGAILVENNAIKKIGSISDFGNLEKYEVVDHKNKLVCPGFINLHTHTTYTSAKNLSGNGGLFPWIKLLLQEVRSWNEENIKASTEEGINELLKNGTTYIAENTSSDLTIDVLVKSPIKSLIGVEVFGTDNEEEVFKSYLNRINKLKEKYNNATFTFSPHAPYNLSSKLWKELNNWSESNQIDLLTHLEESTDEISWWQNKSGSALDLWKETGSLESKLNIWQRYNSGIDFLNKNKLLQSNIIATHLCEANIEDLKMLKEFEIPLIHCPRSNKYLTNKIPSLKQWDDLGIKWCLGTDSKASNYDLNILNELRFAINKQQELYNYSITAKAAFEHITKIPGEILNTKVGVLEENTFADFLVYDNIEKIIDSKIDPYEYIVFNVENNNDLKEVWINGNKILDLEKIKECSAQNTIKTVN